MDLLTLKWDDSQWITIKLPIGPIHPQMVPCHPKDCYA